MADINSIKEIINFKTAFEAVPSKSLLLFPDQPIFTIAAATTDYCKSSGFDCAALVDKGIFEAFPSNNTEAEDTGAQQLLSSLQKVIASGKEDTLELRYDTPDHKGGFQKKYWRTVNKPIFSGDALQYIMHSTEEISGEKELAAQKKQIKDLELVHNIFMQAPIAIHILKGEDLIIDFANEPAAQLWVKSKDFMHRSLTEVLPEIKASGFDKLLLNVMHTGEMLRGYEQPIIWAKADTPEPRFYNYVFQPYYEDDKNKATGVLLFLNDITEKVKTEQGYKESEARFQQIANTLPLVVWTAGTDGGLTYISDQWESFYGNPVSESLGTGWANFVHPDDVATAGSKWTASLQSGENYETEFRVNHKDDHWRWILVRAVPLRDAAGNITAWYGSNTDIQDKKTTEESIKESEQQVRSLVESAPFPIGVYIGKEMRIALANQSILDVWGKGNDVIGKIYADILPELDNQQIFQQLDGVFTTGVPFHAKNERVDLIIDDAWRSFWFNYSFTPLFDAEGKVYGVMNTAAEVTDLNIAKIKIEASENNFRNTILKAPVAMCILKGPNFIIEIVNERMAELWGTRKAAEVMSRPIFEAVPETAGQGFETILENVYKTGETYSAQDLPIKLQRGEGVETVYVTFVYEAYREKEGDISGIIAVAVDVTAQVIARKKIEDIVAERTKELAEANINLQRSNAELAQFAYIASHDLQEPLRKISVFSQMLGQHLTEVGIDAQTQNFLTKISSSSARMTNLVRDVLVYSELSKQADIMQPVDLQETVDGIKTDFELMVEQKDALISFKDLPTVQGIPLQLSQLFGNLISNALKFSRSDIRPEIRITAKKLSAEEREKYAPAESNTVYWNIEVTDNGIGFNSEYAQQIFNIFQRLHGKSAYSGTGIGLAMCKKIAINHHGEIYASASENKGAVFNVILPETQEGL